jgi:single-stranded DNA-binding protein
VEGRIEARTYVDKDNNNRKAVEIIAEYIHFLEFKPRSDAPLSNSDDVPLPDENTVSPSQITKDDVPF